ncbi:MAG: hypothetical protein EHM58_19825 [Ignavibacteriae bacterium]|nr:MAG: hypothetical protein EHM58_19825 [Ignavibacteriota bacterium]
MAICIFAFAFTQNTFAQNNQQQGGQPYLNVFVWNQLHTAGQDDARVRVINSNNVTILTGLTQNGGMIGFGLLGVPAGTYTVIANYPDFPNDYCSGYVVWIYDGQGTDDVEVTLGNTY